MFTILTCWGISMGMYAENRIQKLLVQGAIRALFSALAFFRSCHHYTNFAQCFTVVIKWGTVHYRAMSKIKEQFLAWQPHLLVFGCVGERGNRGRGTTTRHANQRVTFCSSGCVVADGALPLQVNAIALTVHEQLNTQLPPNISMSAGVTLNHFYTTQRRAKYHRFMNKASRSP